MSLKGGSQEVYLALNSLFELTKDLTVHEEALPKMNFHQFKQLKQTVSVSRVGVIGNGAKVTLFGRVDDVSKAADILKKHFVEHAR